MLKLLCEVLRRDLVPKGDTEVRRRVWAVDQNDVVYERKSTNKSTTEYHGFPLLKDDPLCDLVRKAWKERAS